MSTTETKSDVERAQRTPADLRLHYYGAQNVPLLLSIGILVAMIMLYLILFVLAQRRLPGSFELSTTLNNTMSVGLAAVGQTLVVLTGGIDLSVGGIVDVTNSVAAQTMHDNPGSMLGITLLVLAIGAGAGLINGLLGNIGIVPSSLVIFILLILLWQVLRRTRFLVTLYAIGNDERAARANGVPVNLAKIGAYTVGGLFSGAAGLYLAAVATSGDATSGTPLTLTSIAAVVLGGVSLFGGRGSAVGSLVGACILTLLLNVLFFAGINPQLQEFFQGLFLILAVVASTLVRRFLQSER